MIDPSASSLVTAVRKDCDAQQTLLREEARRAAWLILWLDCDREGEAIAHEVHARPRRAGGAKRVLLILTPRRLPAYVCVAPR